MPVQPSAWIVQKVGPRLLPVPNVVHAKLARLVMWLVKSAKVVLLGSTDQVRIWMVVLTLIQLRALIVLLEEPVAQSLLRALTVAQEPFWMLLLKRAMNVEKERTVARPWIPPRV